MHRHICVYLYNLRGHTRLIKRAVFLQIEEDFGTFTRHKMKIIVAGFLEQLRRHPPTPNCGERRNVSHLSQMLL